ncbi:MAG: Bug family tripartite tricarboxylate transporter substrate binding protein, partial [Betaproteobacteria bacterium]
LMKIVVALALCLVAFAAHAQSYPNRPVRMIVPFAPGGTTDGLGRVLAHFLGERLRQQVVVENRPGGGGTVGAEAGARATPDGYTILLGSAEAFGMTEAMRRRLPYDPQRDLVPVTMVARSPNVFIVHPSVKATSVDELIRFAKANPGRIRYGSPGVGSNPHLIGEVFAHRAGIRLVHVPYKGGGAGIADVVSGEIEMLITGVVTAAGRINSGQVRPLVLTGSARTPLMPDVPVMAEVGINDFVLGALFGVFVPAKTPKEPIERLARELPEISRNADYRKRIVDIGQEVSEPLQGEAFGRVIRAEAARWRETAAQSGVKDE